MTTIDVLKEMLEADKERLLSLNRRGSFFDAIAEEVQQRIDALTDAIRQLEWTPVSERFPTMEDTKDGYVMIYRVTGIESIKRYDEIQNTDATHWRALPAAPESEEGK